MVDYSGFLLSEHLKCIRVERDRHWSCNKATIKIGFFCFACSKKKRKRSKRGRKKSSGNKILLVAALLGAVCVVSMYYKWRCASLMLAEFFIVLVLTSVEVKTKIKKKKNVCVHRNIFSSYFFFFLCFVCFTIPDTTVVATSVSYLDYFFWFFFTMIHFFLLFNYFVRFVWFRWNILHLYCFKSGEKKAPLHTVDFGFFLEINSIFMCEIRLMISVK